MLFVVFVFASVLSGCKKNESGNETLSNIREEEQALEAPEDGSKTVADEALTTKPEGNYIELALNVYYNDGITGYYANESGSSIYVTREGTYTVSFDCEKDLSNDAINAGVSSLTNLTAIYLLDMGVAKNEQSPLSSCNIMYEEMTVDETKLTITQTEPKSAFKSSGIFDTNDPVNAWDGSLVEEVFATDDHVANFVGVSDPKKVTLTFTLSDMEWGASEQVTEETTSGSGYTNEAVFSNMDFTNMNALELTKYLGNGINLGNTMEAYGRTNFGTAAPVKSYETYWGQPVTTAEMFKGMKDCGFDTVRIPVAWTNMIAYETGDYTINAAYLDRVEELVDYALDAEMFVVINDHWDGGWWAMFGSSDAGSVQNAWDLYESMWTQIATRFKDHSDMLIFESANEELGDGLNDNTDWKDSGSLKKDDMYRLTNEINQRFVDVVRSTGGNNDDRFLLVAGYNTDIDMTVDDRFKMPTDTASGKLLISVHYYSPWNYCGDGKQANWGLKSEYDYMNAQFKKMTKFTDAGFGVIVGEYAALMVDSQAGELKTNTVGFTNNLLDNCDIYNYCPCLWSCNDFFRKTKLTMVNEEITELFTQRCYAEEQKAGDAYLDTVRANMEAAYAAAPDMWEGIETYEAGTNVAWIMWNGGAGTYSVGDTFNPADNTAGITATNAVVEGAGEYEVSLDFAGGNDGVTFAALAVADGEIAYPGMYINITEISVDGKALTLTATPYTSSDDGKCTRVNLVNEWVKELPSDARSLGGLGGASAVILDKNDLVGIKNITVKFRVIITNQ